MVISSLVVGTLPDHTKAAADAIAQREGVEVHEIVGNKIVVTIEAASSNASHDVAAAFTAIEGVLTVNLVYVNFEDETLGAKKGA